MYRAEECPCSEVLLMGCFWLQFCDSCPYLTADVCLMCAFNV
jgi:hypothetical protein